MTSPWGSLNYERHFRYPEEPLFIDSIFGKDGRVYRWKLGKAGVELLRFDRQGKPIPFKATGTNALFVDHPMQVGFWHDVYHGMDVDAARQHLLCRQSGRRSKIAARKCVRRLAPPGQRVRRGRELCRTRGLLRLDCVRGIQVDDEGNLYVVHRPAERPWEDILLCQSFRRPAGEPLWSGDGRAISGSGPSGVFAPCHCITSRHHQTLDGKGYLYAAGKYSVQVIDCETGKLVGEFGSYGNMDCQGEGSKFPHPELPFGTISALSVWKDRLFVVDVLNRRIVKCRIIYGPDLREGDF